MSDTFGKIYPFTTENIAEYFPLLDLKDKSILTVGSSLDQAFNALVFGSKDVLVYDINEATYQCLQKKRELVLTKPRNEFCKAVFQLDDVPFLRWMTPLEEVVRRNTYLQSDYAYKTLRNRLEEDNINFICGDIFELDGVLDDDYFDRMIFSNVLSYIDLFSKDKEILPFLAEKFSLWDKHLNKGGLLQLLYYYNYTDGSYNDKHVGSIPKIKETLGKELELKYFGATYDYRKEDAILVYKK